MTLFKDGMKMRNGMKEVKMKAKMTSLLILMMAMALPPYGGPILKAIVIHSIRMLLLHPLRLPPSRGP